MNGQNTIVRAVDVGFGNVKFTKGMDSSGREVLCDMIPSLAAHAAANSTMESSDRDTVMVEVDGTVFEVGKDAMHAMDTTDSRTMDIMFPTKPEYVALVRGALYYMDVDRVDMLVVGLPVSSISSLGERVKQRMIGAHKVGAKTVVVDDCKVVAQPVGGLWDFAARSNNIQLLKESTAIIIDPGWFTLDWILAQDMKLMTARSGAANNAGMGAVIRAIGQSLANSIGKRESKAFDLSEQLMQKIDRALRGDMHVTVNQRREPLEPHLAAGQRIMKNGMKQLLASIGSQADIDTSIVVGGPASLYTPAICEVFGQDSVRPSFEPVYANVRGFHIIGMKAVRSTHAASRAAA